jgi:hypothetical protein
MTVRHSSKRHKAPSSTLPDELRSFESWYYPGGLSNYMRALSRFVEGNRVTPVMNAAGLSAADWFRHMLDSSNISHSPKVRATEPAVTVISHVVAGMADSG